MIKHLISTLGLCVICSSLLLSQPIDAAEVSGDLMKWHKVTLTFDGPETSETTEPNPFLFYRLDVTFKHAGSGKS